MACNVNLCYGVAITIANLSDAIGADIGPVNLEECGFCNKKFEGEKVNFCSNCGADCRTDISSISAKDVVELMMIKYGEPPRALSIAPADNAIVIGMIIGSGVGIAAAKRAPEAYKWGSVGTEIKNYVEKLGLDPMEPTLLAIALKEE